MKTELIAALRNLTTERRRQIGKLLNLRASDRSDRKHIPSADSREIAESILQGSMDLKDRVLRETAVCSLLKDEQPFARLMCRLTFHDFNLVQIAAGAQRGMRVGA